MPLLPAFTPDDLRDVERLWGDYAREAHADPCFVSLDAERRALPGPYAPPDGGLWLARDPDTGEALGCVALRDAGPAAPRAAELRRLYIRPDARRLGLGRDLAALAIRAARGRGRDAVVLDSLPSMHAALALYRAMGFEPILHYQPDPPIGALAFRLPVGRAPATPRAPVDVSLHDDTARLDQTSAARLRARLADAAEEALLRLRPGPAPAGGELRVRIVGDDEMARLHLRHADVPGSTDVLTFDLREDPRQPLDTDAVLCLDEADRNAAAVGTSPEHELLLYGLHAVLHSVGFDDHDEHAFTRMHALEDDVLAAVGVGPVFMHPVKSPGADRVP